MIRAVPGTTIPSIRVDSRPTLRTVVSYRRQSAKAERSKFGFSGTASTIDMWLARDPGRKCCVTAKPVEKRGEGQTTPSLHSSWHFLPISCTFEASRPSHPSACPCLCPCSVLPEPSVVLLRVSAESVPPTVIEALPQLSVLTMALLARLQPRGKFGKGSPMVVVFLPLPTD